MDDSEVDSVHERQCANAHVQGIAVVHCKEQGGSRTLALVAADEGFLRENMNPSIADWKGIALPASFEAAVLSALDEGLLSFRCRFIFLGGMAVKWKLMSGF